MGETDPRCPHTLTLIPCNTAFGSNAEGMRHVDSICQADHERLLPEGPHGGILVLMPEQRYEPVRPLRILFVSPGATVGAHLVFVRREANALASAGHVVEVFRFDNASYLPWRILFQVLRLKRTIRDFRPDVLHAQFGKFNAMVAALAKGRLPLVITFRGTDINRNLKYGWLRCAIGFGASQLAAWFADALVCVSGEIESKIWVRHRRPCIVAPTGVELRTFVPMDRDEARRQLGFGARERIVLFNAGRNPAVKDPELAAAAVEVAKKIVGGIRAVVLDGTTEPEDMPTYMNAADCLLVTSRTEGSPTVVQEAMACNLPVISVDVGDVRERIGRVAGCTVVERDPAALGVVLARVLHTQQRSNGRIHVEELGVDKVVAQLGRFYGRLLRDIMPARRLP